MPDQRRQVAYKVRIADILNGRYVKEEGWEPNYVLTDSGKNVSRANIIATIVLKSAEEGVSYQSLVVDDASGRISIRSFDDSVSFDDVDIGDTIMLIGRPREFGSVKYVVPEIIKKIIDPKWIELRKLELQKLEKEKPVVQKTEAKQQVTVEKTEDSSVTRIIGLVKERDPGTGADTEEIIKSSQLENAEDVILNLLKNGDIFEVSPGKIKVLE